MYLVQKQNANERHLRGDAPALVQGAVGKGVSEVGAGVHALGGLTAVPHGVVEPRAVLYAATQDGLKLGHVTVCVGHGKDAGGGGTGGCHRACQNPTPLPPWERNAHSAMVSKPPCQSVVLMSWIAIMPPGQI